MLWLHRKDGGRCHHQSRHGRKRGHAHPSASSSSGSNHNGDTSSAEMRCTRATRAKQAIDVDQPRGARWEGGREGDEGVSRAIRAAKHPRRWLSRDSLGRRVKAAGATGWGREEDAQTGTQTGALVNSEPHYNVVVYGARCQAPALKCQGPALVSPAAFSLPPLPSPFPHPI
jgi:hypothetical protein